MKIKHFFKVLIAVAVISTGAITSIFAQTKSKSLVLYFSRADENYTVGTITEGNTVIIAKMIASKTGSDMFEVVPEKAYPKKYKECIELAKDELRKKARPAYKGDFDTSGYDTVYIGWPVWWGDLPMVLYTFLETHDLNGKTIVPFTTHEGSGLANASSAMKKLYPKSEVKNGLAIYGHTAQNQRKEAEKSVDDWLNKLGMN